MVIGWVLTVGVSIVTNGLIDDLCRKVGIVPGMNEYLEPALFINREEVTGPIINLINLVVGECIGLLSLEQEQLNPSDVWKKLYGQDVLDESIHNIRKHFGVKDEDA